MVYAYVSQGLIYQTKPKTSNFDPLKFELDISTHASDKGGVKIVVDLRTPCSVCVSFQHIDPNLHLNRLLNKVLIISIELRQAKKTLLRSLFKNLLKLKQSYRIALLYISPVSML